MKNKALILVAVILLCQVAEAQKEPLLKRLLNKFRHRLEERVERKLNEEKMLRWHGVEANLFCSPAEARTITGGVSNERGLIGVRTCDRKVERVYLDSPAWRAGVKAGDKIVLVDGNARSEIIGEPFQTVQLCIHRRDKQGLLEVLNLEMERVPEDEIKRRHFEYLRDH